MMAYGKAEGIPRDRPGCGRLYGMIGELQKTLLRTIPLLIDRLNPGTFSTFNLQKSRLEQKLMSLESR